MLRECQLASTGSTPGRIRHAVIRVQGKKATASDSPNSMMHRDTRACCVRCPSTFYSRAEIDAGRASGGVLGTHAGRDGWCAISISCAR